MCYLLKKYSLLLLRWVSRISDRRHVNTTENEMSPIDIFISNWFDVCQWSNNSKTMLLWSGLLVLLVLLAGFPWNMARSQLHQLSLTVKISRCGKITDPQVPPPKDRLLVSPKDIVLTSLNYVFAWSTIAAHTNKVLRLLTLQALEYL